MMHREGYQHDFVSRVDACGATVKRNLAAFSSQDWKSTSEWEESEPQNKSFFLHSFRRRTEFLDERIPELSRRLCALSERSSAERVEFKVRSVTRHQRIACSSTTNESYKHSLIVYMTFVHEATNSLFHHEFVMCSDPPEIFLTKISEKIHFFERISRLPIVPMPSMSETVHVDGAVAATIAHEALGHLLEADNDAMRNAVGVYVGRNITDLPLTVIDDPQIPDSLGESKFDDEGSESIPVVLVDRGRIAGLLVDARSSRRLGLARNGRGFSAQLHNPPLARMTNTRIAGQAQQTWHPDDFDVSVFGSHGGVALNQDVSIGYQFGLVREGGSTVGRTASGSIVAHRLDIWNWLLGIGREVAENNNGECMKRGQLHQFVSCASPDLVFDGCLLSNNRSELRTVKTL